LLLKEYDALAAFIQASERGPDLIVVVVYESETAERAASIRRPS
jgi:hypothetical protein